MTQASDATIRDILRPSGEDAALSLAAIDEALRDHPDDARLHFLKGSLLIGLKRFIAAHQALTRAVELDPGYHLARFQLGFFELTSGEAETALATLAALKALPEDHWLRCFADGLEHLAADRFGPCIARLRAGIATNHENPALNADMELIVAACERLVAGEPEPEPAPAREEVSATSLLLGSTRRTGG